VSRSDTAQPKLDETDRKILRIMQRDATISFERLAKKVNISKTAVWNRIQRLQQSGVIIRQAAIVDGRRAGLQEVFFVTIRTNSHDAGWLENFHRAIQEMPEIQEAHRLAGEIDYLLKVRVPSTAEFDAFYKRLISQISIYNVTSSLSMEVLKDETALPV
jgi:Lrp/AsnC family transcriptional regulator